MMSLETIVRKKEQQPKPMVDAFNERLDFMRLLEVGQAMKPSEALLEAHKRGLLQINGQVFAYIGAQKAYCAMGAIHHVLGGGNDNELHYLDWNDIRKKYGIPHDIAYRAVYYNDSRHMNFEQIGEWLRSVGY